MSSDENNVEFRKVQDAVFGFHEGDIHIGQSREEVEQHVEWFQANRDFYEHPDEYDPYDTEVLQAWEIRDDEPIATVEEVGFYEGKEGTVIVASEDQQGNWIVTGVGKTENDALSDYIFSVNHIDLLEEIASENSVVAGDDYD